MAVLFKTFQSTVGQIKRNLNVIYILKRKILKMISFTLFMKLIYVIRHNKI